MIPLKQTTIRLGEVFSDLFEAAFVALAWIEEGESLRPLAAGPHRAVRAPLKIPRRRFRRAGRRAA